MAVSHTRTYWQSHLQELCATKSLPSPTYEVFEHSGGSIPMDRSPSSADAGANASPSATHFGQSWYSCVVSVGETDYETSYVYKAEENAKERAAKKAFEALNNNT
ncbi:hypothetical protein DFP73DRAFT_601043 [Morchella snyderi]|nr:hypothetical protein DFP73DRAFT_601043 [Morchella snyderi]